MNPASPSREPIAANNASPLQALARNWHLWRTLTSQDLAARYRGTLLGRLWPVLLPMVMFATYAFVFGVIFRARWPGFAEGDMLGFSLNLFVGLLIHGLLGESLGQAPSLMQRNSNFVRKMVFPLPVLVAVPLGSAVIHGGIGLIIVCLLQSLFHAGPTLSMLSVPLILLPYLFMLFGLCLFAAALGVYFRDLAQIIGVLVMMLLFTAPVFYPQEMAPAALGKLLPMNPITWPVTATRNAILHGQWPAPSGWMAYTLVSLAVAYAGARVFAALKRGFADLI